MSSTFADPSVDSDETDSPLLDVRGVSVEYPRPGCRRVPVRALTGVDLRLYPGETVGVIGESGSGKSTLGKAILGLTRAHSGKIIFAGDDITNATRKRRRELSQSLQVVFQDPYGSLNPARTIGQTLAESLTSKGGHRSQEIRDRIADALRRVQMPADATGRYPAWFSGGQRQRIAIARAILPSPRLIVCDEPVSNLDLSVQAQVLNLLLHLQQQEELSMIFISHDLSVVRYLSRRIVVLYHGSVVEEGPAAEVCQNSRHPYTRALLAASLLPDPAAQHARRRARLARTVTSGRDVPDSGCPFAPRCSFVEDECLTAKPPLLPAGDGVKVACVRYPEIASQQGGEMA